MIETHRRVTPDGSVTAIFTAVKWRGDNACQLVELSDTHHMSIEYYDVEAEHFGEITLRVGKSKAEAVILTVPPSDYLVRDENGGYIYVVPEMLLHGKIEEPESEP